MAKRRAEVNGIRYSTEKSAVPGLNIINVPNNPNKTIIALKKPIFSLSMGIDKRHTIRG